MRIKRRVTRIIEVPCDALDRSTDCAPHCRPAERRGQAYVARYTLYAGKGGRKSEYLGTDGRWHLVGEGVVLPEIVWHVPERG